MVEAGLLPLPESLIPFSLLKDTAQFVEAELAKQDASHDFFHVLRVKSLALTIAQKEIAQLQAAGDGPGAGAIDLGVVEMGALLHDVGDVKYSGRESAQAEAITAFLTTHAVPADVLARILTIATNCSYRKELKSGPAAVYTRETMIVQDADKLDAIGAIGIARCFAFSGSRPGTTLWDPAVRPLVGMTKAEYDAQTKAGGSSAINHFHEKLFLLKDTIRTASGQAIAQARHDYMKTFVDRFTLEWEGKA